VRTGQGGVYAGHPTAAKTHGGTATLEDGAEGKLVDSRWSRARKGVRVLIAGLASVLLLGVWSSVTLAAALSVHVTRYSPAVSGNIGVAKAGVNVTVSLIRDGATIESSPVAATDSSGAWTATLPGHAPSDALDIVNVQYSGSGAPAEASYGDASSSETKAGLGFFDQGLSIGASGASGGALCTHFAAVKCAALTAEVSYSGGGTAEVAGVPDPANEDIEELPFSPAVGPNDAVTVTGSFEEENGSTFQLTVPAPLPGVGNVFAANGSTAPRCSADLVTLAVSCAPLSTGSYSLTQVRGGTNLGSHPATVASGSETSTFQLASVQAGDELALSVAETGGRLLTTLHPDTLSVEAAETLSFGSIATRITGGKCQANAWFGAVGGAGVCPSSGIVPADSPTALEDELSGGATTVTPPLISYTSPMDGENVYGAGLTAFADLNTGATTPVTLSATPIGGGSAIAATGNPNSASGAKLSGLAAGTRYVAAWQLMDPDGNVVSLTSHFVDQAGNTGPEGSPGKEGPGGKEGATGKEGSQGKEGVAGKDGAAGAQGQPGPPGPAAEILCTTKKVKVVVSHKAQTKTQTSCVVKQLPPGAAITTTSLMLTRGQVVYALGRVKGRASTARVAMHDLRAVRPGTYTLVVVFDRGHGTTTTSYRVRVTGSRY